MIAAVGYIVEQNQTTMVYSNFHIQEADYAINIPVDEFQIWIWPFSKPIASREVECTLCLMHGTSGANSIETTADEQSIILLVLQIKQKA